jgi:hypothetical protein
MSVGDGGDSQSSCFVTKDVGTNLFFPHELFAVSLVGLFLLAVAPTVLR